MHEKENGGYRVQSPILLPAKLCVHARESTGGPNYLSLIIQPHLFEDPSTTEFTERVHLVCIPYPGLIKGYSICYTIACHMQELVILNLVVCSGL